MSFNPDHHRTMEQIEGSSPSGGISIQDVAAILWRRKWIFCGVLIAMLAASYRFALSRKPTWSATAQMIVTERGTAISTTTEANPGAPASIMAIESPQTQIGMLQSDGMADRTLNKLKNDALASGKPLSSIGPTDTQLFRLVFAGAVKVTNPTDTNLLQVSVDSDTPDRASSWANATCQAFVEWKKDLAKRTIQEIVDNLEARANKARDSLVEAERLETAYKQQNHLVDLPTQEHSALEQYVLREAEAATARQDLTTAQANLQALQNQLDEMNTAIRQGDGIRSDEDVVRMQTQLHDLQTQRIAAAQKYRAAYPGILSGLDAQIKDLQDRIDTAAKGTAADKLPSLAAQGALLDQYRQAQRMVLTDQARVASAENLRDALKSNLAGFPQAALEYARLARNTEMAQQVSSSLQLSLNTAKLDMDNAVGNVEITQAAYTPLLPSGLPPIRIVIAGGLLGLLLAFGASLLVERADHRIRTVERVRQVVHGPIIGMVPRLSWLQLRQLTRGKTPSHALEAYSHACANLLLMMRHGAPDDVLGRQIVMVTSAAPNEGKSMTAAEVARFMARAGKSVILVDADMRRPSQSRLFGIEPSTGLAEVLSGETAPEVVLIETDEPNLAVLPSGKAKRNPIHLVSSTRMGDVLNRLRDEADIVIVDTPACGMVGDALLIAPYVDCILQVVATGVVDEKLVSETTDALRTAAARTLAFCVNRAPKDRYRIFRPYYFREYAEVGATNGHSRPGGGQITYALPKPTDETGEQKNDDHPTAS